MHNLPKTICRHSIYLLHQYYCASLHIYIIQEENFFSKPNLTRFKRTARRSGRGEWELCACSSVRKNCHTCRRGWLVGLGLARFQQGVGVSVIIMLQLLLFENQNSG
jgi:hypothetical protein